MTAQILKLVPKPSAAALKLQQGLDKLRERETAIENREEALEQKVENEVSKIEQAELAIEQELKADERARSFATGFELGVEGAHAKAQRKATLKKEREQEQQLKLERERLKELEEAVENDSARENEANKEAA